MTSSFGEKFSRELNGAEFSRLVGQSNSLKFRANKVIVKSYIVSNKDSAINVGVEFLSNFIESGGIQNHVVGNVSDCCNMIGYHTIGMDKTLPSVFFSAWMNNNQCNFNNPILCLSTPRGFDVDKYPLFIFPAHFSKQNLYHRGSFSRIKFSISRSVVRFSARE